jgi:fatty-acyl-CoA synthase
VIISGGENIYPAELERLIREIDGVTQVSVVGRSHERWGEVPVAVVAGDATLTQQQVRVVVLPDLNNYTM